MHVVCIDDPKHPLGYRVYSGFETLHGMRTGRLNSSDGVVVMTFTKPDAKIISGNVYLTAEYAAHDMLRVLRILEEDGAVLPKLFIKPCSELREDLLHWQ